MENVGALEKFVTIEEQGLAEIEGGIAPVIIYYAGVATVFMANHIAKRVTAWQLQDAKKQKNNA